MTFYLIIAGVKGAPVICDLCSKPTPAAYRCPRCGQVLCLPHDCVHECDGKGAGPAKAKPGELLICPRCWRREGDPEAPTEKTWIGLCDYCCQLDPVSYVTIETFDSKASRRNKPPPPAGGFHFGITNDEKPK